jgi:hypothetical protein
LAVWNDAASRTEMPSDSSWGRTPLALAISRDEARSWSESQLIEDDPRRGFCYVSMHFTDDAVLLGYQGGGRDGGVLQDCCIRRIELDSIYD